MKRKLSFIFLRITGLAVLATFVLTAILQANNEAAKRARCYMPFFTELLLSFVLLPAAISLSFLSILVQAGQVSSPFEILHMAATLIPVSVLIGWEYGKFKK